ncbi:MAG: aminotransferase class V-fold PLP-dependent enzyme [Planctomycetes bacterium]|nr:aminotransferase class V-fold PLP-dependent enzyme [Planctomycetota bacterium]MCB9887999.1 aminotransferase class V-fold PLP-dependent enzyme [Planctomycetota bacterium]
MDDPLSTWRGEFPIVQSTNYLISNSLGAMPKAARASVGRYVDLWDQRGVRAWADEWWVLKDRFADLCAGILGVPSGSVSMHQNVAMASEAILSCFDFSGTRNRIVYTELNFPSVMYLYEGQRSRGAEIVRVPGDAEGITVDTQRLLDAIDERTLLVPISHALFRSSFLQDVPAIVEKARRVGAFVILDVFQSVGTVPLSLREWGVHAAVGGALKYLCGGPGNCFLYVDPDERARLRPAFTGWAAHKDPFAFSIDGQDYRDDGGRFLNGTPNVPALYAGLEGVRIIAEIGVAAIRENSRRLTAKIIERAQHHGLKVRSPLDADRRSGHVSIDVPDGYEVCQALLAEDIIADYRPAAGIRLSPHFYTLEAECIEAVDRIAAILADGEHLRFKGKAHQPG